MIDIAFLSPCNTVAFLLCPKTMSTSLRLFLTKNHYKLTTIENLPQDTMCVMLLRDPKFRLISAQTQAFKQQNFITVDQLVQLNQQGIFLTDGHSNDIIDEKIIILITCNKIIIVPMFETDENLPYNITYTFMLLDLFFKEYKLDLRMKDFPWENKSRENYNTHMPLSVYNFDSVIFNYITTKISLYKISPEYIKSQNEYRDGGNPAHRVKISKRYEDDISFYDVYPRNLMLDLAKLSSYFNTNP